MTTITIGYARCSTDKQDLAAQKAALEKLGVRPERIYTDHGLTGTNRDRAGLTQALAALRAGDTLVVPKLDRLPRSVPDARAVGDSLAARGGRLSLGGTVYDPADPDGQVLLQHPGHVRGVRGRSAADADPGGHGGRAREGQAQGQAAKAESDPARVASQAAERRRAHDCRAGRAVLSEPRYGVPRARAGA